MSRKSIPKKIRDEVKAKYGGRCAYCGETPSVLHIDRVVPVAHSYRHASLELNAAENLMPACPSCNNYKMSFNLESFRANLADQVRMARAYSVNFRLAERFGLLEVKQKPIQFYFETQERK